MARALDDRSWARDAQALAGGAAEVAPDARPPSFHDLAMTGLTLVEALVAAGRWDEARTQARHLAGHFHEMRRGLHPVAAAGFGGLHDAVRSRDRDGIDDHAELLREILGGPGNSGA